MGSTVCWVAATAMPPPHLQSLGKKDWEMGWPWTQEDGTPIFPTHALVLAKKNLALLCSDVNELDPNHCQWMECNLTGLLGSIFFGLWEYSFKISLSRAFIEGQ